ncbi:MAG: hypothetical protein L0Y79_10895 [Chlorobi bacterium]|nr:hypothetical protein [Chlorobiota bacterium]MCI0715564.1 hypothetical protein [Chlorobiota bacterium]
MKTNKSILILIIANLLIMMESNSQIKSVLDSKENKYFIGFEIFVQADNETKIQINKENSLDKYVLFDSTLNRDEYVVFIYSEYFEAERVKYKDKLIIKIPEISSGAYYLVLKTKQKFIFIK